MEADCGHGAVRAGLGTACLSAALLRTLNESLFVFLVPRSSSVSHDAQLPKPLQHILVHATQPVLLEPLLAARSLHSLLDVLPHKGDEIDLVHGIRVQEVALPHVLRGLGLGRVVRLGGPVERTDRTLASTK